MQRSFVRRIALVGGLGLAVVAPLAASAAPHSHAPASFRAYVVTNGHNAAAHGGEPSIGFDPKRHAVIYGASAHETRMVFHGAGVTQTDVSAPTASVTTLDAITVVDQHTGRAFDVQLLGACSAQSYSDDAGANWTPTSGCGPDALLDHESLGAGPYHAPIPKDANPIYPDAVYYCAQNGVNAFCSLSVDGGLTYLPGTPISDTPINSVGDPFGGGCSGLHGHIRVGPDGTAYVPIKGCGGAPTANNLTNEEFWGGHPAVAVSDNNGATWTTRVVPGGRNEDESDNAVAADKANRLYMAWEDGHNPTEIKLAKTSAAKVAFSDNEGLTWSKPVDLSTPLGLHNIQFPEIIAGDKGRAAVAFLGTKAIGDDQHNGMKGPDGKPPVWDLYVSMTYDGGKHWKTVDTTPHDPVQRGCVDLQGLSNKTVTDKNICGQRNLLDFNDITVDDHGRVLVAYADGCTGSCVHNPNMLSKDDTDMVMRLSGGKGLYAKYDGKLGPVRSAPLGSAVLVTPLALAALLTRPNRRRRRR